MTAFQLDIPSDVKFGTVYADPPWALDKPGTQFRRRSLAWKPLLGSKRGCPVSSAAKTAPHGGIIQPSWPKKAEAVEPQGQDTSPFEMPTLECRSCGRTDNHIYCRPVQDGILLIAGMLAVIGVALALIVVFYG